MWSAKKKLSYFVDTLNFVESERSAGKTIYPPSKDVFNAFRYTEFSDVKVVILGQDPYHGPNQAHGLCFSVLPGVRTPPSLVNIYKELAQDIDGFEILNMDSCKVGPSKVYYCLIPCWRLSRAKHIHIRKRDGKRSLIKWLKR